jgi:hypothetical protein
MVPRKNLYIPEADAGVWEEAEQLISRRRSVFRRSLSAVVTDLLRGYVEEEKRKEEAVQTSTETIRVEVGGHHNSYRPVEFEGRWLVEPNPEETRTTEAGYDAGAYWGVALTKRGNIAVYTAHVNDGFDAILTPYGSFEEAEAEGVPADILGAASVDAGPDYVHVQKLDI